MHLITITCGGISAKQLERELGVTYKTAWRMFNLIRNELMTDEIVPLTGAVEVDETAWGGRPKVSATRGMRFMPQAQTYVKARKVGVLAICRARGQGRATSSRATGRFRLVSCTWTPRPPSTPTNGSSTAPHESHPAHYTIRHTDKVYASGHVHTQTVEAFFGNVKRGISGVYHSVSTKSLQRYLNEYTWRYNHRDYGTPMFLTLLSRAADDLAADLKRVLGS